MDQSIFYERLFNKLQESKGGKNWKEELSKLLNISTNAIYKKIRGENQLSVAELLLITTHYGISLDNIISDDPQLLSFTFTPIHQPILNHDMFLSSINDDLNKLRVLKDVTVYYASTEMPIFYYLAYPHLAAFKLFYWGRTIWKLPNSKTYEDLQSIFKNTRLRFLSEQLLQTYQAISSTEIWSTHIIDNTLNQIRFYEDIGVLKDKGFIEGLILELKRMLSDMEHSLTMGKKHESSEGILKVYFNAMTHTNNIIFVNHEKISAVYTTYDNPNFLKTMDSRLCNYTLHYMRKLIDQSNQISMEAEGLRTKFIQQLQDKVDQLNTDLL